MPNRKYFKHSIIELEAIFANANNDFAILEELEEELEIRTTQRAKKLLNNVQNALSQTDNLKKNSHKEQTLDKSKIVNNNYDSISKTISRELQDTEIIDWNTLILNSTSHKFDIEDGNIQEKQLHNSPHDILDTWTALESLSPQSYKNPKDLVIGKGSVAYLNSGQEPWLKGERSIPKCNLYYLVYLGAVDLQKATTQLLSVYQDKRAERPQVNGLAALGVVLLDKNGVPVPDTGLAISSFGWAYTRAIKGNLRELKHWELAESILKKGLEKIIYQQDEEGNLLPLSLYQTRKAFEWLVNNCELPLDECTAPSFAIRLYQPFSRGEPEAPLLNSFFLEDLEKAKKAINNHQYGEALARYIGIKTADEKYDVLKDKSHIERALEPKKMPLARWPSKGRHSLVLLQQLAVNLSLDELQSNGLFSVNGPPGTGKTTLLRDIVAAVLVKRAKGLLKFNDPEDAFKHSGKFRLGNSFVHLYEIDESLRGHEILVASSNNKAVENISKELPLKSQIADEFGELNYFKTLSNELAKQDGEEETWGLIAAVLGNSKNRSNFVNKMWWDDNTALQKYFKYITGQLNFEVDESGDEIIPRIIQECQPPSNTEEAMQRWVKAKKDFTNALKAVESATASAQNALDNYHLIIKLKALIDDYASKQVQLSPRIKQAETKSNELCAVQIQKEGELKLQKEKENLSLIQKPGIFKRIFARAKWKAWKSSHTEILSKLSIHREKYNNAFKNAHSAKKTLETLENELREIKLSQSDLEEKLANTTAKLEACADVCGGKLVTPELWELDHKDQQMFIPNFTDQSQHLRDDLFVSAIKLNKAFIDASGKKLRQNMAAFFAALGGKPLPSDKQHLLSHLWSSAFLVVPVMSTTFASVGRMLRNLPKESLGWLLIDEAGQASPQQAVGAIFRAKRVVTVGDPLQIEPVVTLPTSIIESISKHLGVDPMEWTAPDTSVQSLSDKANKYGTIIDRELSEIRIGTPLLVHRRCEDPMFSISNNLAYNGLMVHATASQPSEMTQLFGSQSCWFDVRGSAQEKWCPEEGEHVCNMILKAGELFGEDLNIFVITPFRLVAEHMRRRMQQEKERLSSFGISNVDDWVFNNIGTVHTFQGKEAKAVILLLGAPCPSQNGARNWATSNVNLLNVAVSRAKQNFYIVGNKALWGTIGYMQIFNKHLK